MDKANALIEESKMLQNTLLQLLIRPKPDPVFQNYVRPASPRGIILPVINTMPRWIHNMQQFWVDHAVHSARKLL